MTPTFDIDRAVLALVAADRDPKTVPWVPHAKFPGVALRAVMTGAETGGRFSLHQVRIDAGCVIDTHTHPDNWETHQVLAGEGTLTLAGRETPYRRGISAAVPQGVPHRVAAGGGPLYLLATFIPALA